MLIFDCDGVLVDSERLVQRIEQEMIAELGWPITIAEIQAEHLGRPWPAIQANIERHIGRPLPADFRERRVAANDAALRAELTAVPGLPEALQALLDAGHRTCVASSSSHRRIELVLGLTDLLDTFRGRIFSAYDVANGKPAPDLFLHAADRMGVKPAECIVIEDSPAGVAAAVAAGMPVIAYAAATPRGLVADADLAIEHMAELPAAVARLTSPAG